MDRCSKSGIHEHSPNSQIHIQIFHRITGLFSIDFPDHGDDGSHLMRCVQRYLEVVVSRRFRILLAFLANWRTGFVCKWLLPSFIILGNRFSFAVPSLSRRSILLLDATGLPAVFPLTRQGVRPSVALETSTLRRMSLVQYSSCCRVFPKLSASSDF